MKMKENSMANWVRANMFHTFLVHWKWTNKKKKKIIKKIKLKKLKRNEVKWDEGKYDYNLKQITTIRRIRPHAVYLWPHGF